MDIQSIPPHLHMRVPVVDEMDSATTTSVETQDANAPEQRSSKGGNGNAAPARVQETRDRGQTSGKPLQEKTSEPDTTAKPDMFMKKYRHVMAIHHKQKPSVLSRDSTATPSFLGFRNLMVIVLVVGNLRLMIENLQKYGNLVCLTCHDFRREDVMLGLALYITIPGFLWVAHMIELYAARQARGSRTLAGERGGMNSPNEVERKKFNSTWRRIRFAHAINASLALGLTSWVVARHIFHPLIGTATEIHAIIVWLKTASYALTNRDLRHAYLHPVKGELADIPEIYGKCPYPQNITMSNLAYFWFAPTLVYQPVYPRTQSVRWGYVFKRLGEAFCLSVFIWFCSAQYAAPVLRNSLDKINSLDMTSIAERLLKLSTISLVIWLAGFFAVFQSALNALAEIMRFGDRTFYYDWWNAESLADYWRLWNKPVYNFMKRHVYSSLVGRGYGHFPSSSAVFFISAVLHELAVGIPTHNVLGIAFAGMMFQLPLIWVTQPLAKIKGSTGKLIGNCVFWISFTILGQPFAALMYFYAWQAKFGSVSRQTAMRPTTGC